MVLINVYLCEIARGLLVQTLQSLDFMLTLIIFILIITNPNKSFSIVVTNNFRYLLRMIKWPKDDLQNKLITTHTLYKYFKFKK